MILFRVVSTYSLVPRRVVTGEKKFIINKTENFFCACFFKQTLNVFYVKFFVTYWLHVQVKDREKVISRFGIIDSFSHSQAQTFKANTILIIWFSC